MNETKSFIDTLKEHVVSGKAQLPAFDRTGLVIQQEMAKPDPDMQAIDTQILSDPTLTSHELERTLGRVVRNVFKIARGVKPLVLCALGDEPPPLEPLDVSVLDGYLCAVLLQPTAPPRPQWLRFVTDSEGRALPRGHDAAALHALVLRRHAELDAAIARRRWFDPWVFELDADASPSQAVYAWVAAFALGIEHFPALMPLGEVLFTINLDADGIEPVAQIVARITDAMPEGVVALSVRTNHGVARVLDGGRAIAAETVITAPRMLPWQVWVRARIIDVYPCSRVFTNTAQYRLAMGGVVFEGNSNTVVGSAICPDLGDAPDSSNHWGMPMTAYPGVPALFPTVFDSPFGQPRGPKHWNARVFHLSLIHISEPTRPY